MFIYHNPINQVESSLTYYQCSPTALRQGSPTSRPHITRHLPTGSPPGILATIPSVTERHTSSSPSPLALAALPSGTVNYSLIIAQHFAAASPLPRRCLTTKLHSLEPTQQPPPSCNFPIPGILTSTLPTTERRPVAASPPDVEVPSRTITVQNKSIYGGIIVKPNRYTNN